MKQGFDINDILCVRPLGSLNSKWGQLVSIDEDKLSVTIRKQDGEVITITYGQIHNYGPANQVDGYLRKMFDVQR